MTATRLPFSQTVANKTAVIVMNFNRLDLLKECLNHIENSGDTDIFDLYICDHNSTDGSREWLLQNMAQKATLIFEINELGYAESNNRVMKMCRDYKYIYLLNNDAFVEPGWLSQAVSCAERNPDAGHIASKQLDRHYRIQAAGAFQLRDGVTVCAYARRSRDYPPANEEYVVDYAGFGLYLQSTLEKIGYLEERYAPIYFDDNDIGLRVEMVGMKVVYCPKSELRHMMDTSNREHHTGALDNNLRVFQEKFGEYLKTRPLRVRPGAGDAPRGKLPDEWFEGGE